MKKLFTLALLISALYTNAQSLAEFKDAIANGNKKVQGIHKYPENIGKGECHFVEITAITIEGDHVTIVETWTKQGIFGSGKTTTTLTGTIKGNSVEGEWESSLSSGTWSYDFKNNTGKWNKTHSLTKTFDKMEYLSFEIVNNSEIKDGHFKCK